MKKEAEIKLIEQIGELIFKLAESDTYFNDELINWQFKLADIDIMINNIKNDFPISLSTNYRYKMEKALYIYKERCNNLAKMVRAKSFSIKTYENSINDLETDNKALIVSRSNILAEILKLTHASEYKEEDLLSLFPDDLVITMKLDMNYPLTSEEKQKVKTSLNYR